MSHGERFGKSAGESESSPMANPAAARETRRMSGTAKALLIGFGTVAAAVALAAVGMAVGHGNGVAGPARGLGMMSGGGYGGMMTAVGTRQVERPATAASLRGARALVERRLAAEGLTGFRVLEVMAFANHDYAAVRDAQGRPAFELLVDPASGWLMEEPPSMMWNMRYGMRLDSRFGSLMDGAWGGGMMQGQSGFGQMMGGGMMGGGMMGGGPTGMMGNASGWTSAREGLPDGAVTGSEAVALADRWLAQARPGEQAEDEAKSFPGYFTIDTVAGGRIVGMLSVNARTGAVWYHDWHGRFLSEREF